MSSPAIPNSDYLSHLLRQGSKTQAAADDNLTVDVLRYYVTAAGSPRRGIAPTVAAATGLSGLTVSIGQLGNYENSLRAFDGIQVREHFRVFCFLDLPATTSPAVPAGTIQLTDWILHDGRRWRPVVGEVRNDPTTSQSVVLARLWRR